MNPDLINVFNEQALFARNNLTVDTSKNNNINITDNNIVVSGSEESTWDRITNSVGNGVAKIWNDLISSPSISDVRECMPGFGDLFKVGRPVSFHPSIDPGHRIGGYLRNRMALADILPCRFSIPFVDVVQQAQNGNLELRDLLPIVEYDNAINEFKQQCRYYGLPDKFMGLRLYSTDDSGASDTISNAYEANFIQQTADNKLNGILGNVGKMMRSLGTIGDAPLQAMNEYVRTDIIPGLGNVANEILGTVGVDTESDLMRNLGSLASGVVGVISDSVIMGNRISLPEIWSNSDYQPRFSITTKLISPYI